MDPAHYYGLAAGYGIAMLGWVAAHRALPSLWPPPTPPRFDRPWRELGYALLAAIAVLAIGQLYQRGWLLPGKGADHPVLDTLNQVLIFSPVIALLAVRRHGPSTAWLPRRAIPARLAVGLGLALAALTAFATVHRSFSDTPDLIASTYQPGHFRFAVHVFLEDLSIAILFVRLAAALGRPRLVAIAVAALFSAAHIPSNLADGATLVELAPRLLDFALGAGVLLVVCRSADIWWFWCVHFALDMTQFWPLTAGR